MCRAEATLIPRKESRLESIAWCPFCGLRLDQTKATGDLVAKARAWAAISLYCGPSTKDLVTTNLDLNRARREALRLAWEASRNYWGKKLG